MEQQYVNIHSGDKISQKEYRVRMMSYFEEKTTESERAELYDMYGARCMEFWLMTHPHPDYKKCSAEQVTASNPVEEPVSTSAPVQSPTRFP